MMRISSEMARISHKMVCISPEMAAIFPDMANISYEMAAISYAMASFSLKFSLIRQVMEAVWLVGKFCAKSICSLLIVAFLQPRDSFVPCSYAVGVKYG
jgi:hypothetical protein